MNHDQKFAAATERYSYPAFRHYAEWERMVKVFVVRYGSKWGWRVVNGYGETVMKGGFRYATPESARQAATASRPRWYQKKGN